VVLRQVFLKVFRFSAVIIITPNLLILSFVCTIAATYSVAK